MTIKELKREITRSSSPLNAESTMINAIVLIATPRTEMAEMILITLCDFFEKR